MQAMFTAYYWIWILLPSIAFLMRGNYANKLFFTFASLGLAVLAVLGGEYSRDRDAYVNLITLITGDGLAPIEPIYILLIKFLSYISPNLELQLIFFFVVALTSTILKFRLFSRYGGSMFGCVITYLSYYFLIHELTQIRVGLAIGFLYLSWFAWMDCRRQAYYFFGILGSVFHISCLIFFVAPWLFAYGKTQRWQVTISCLVLLSVVSLFWPAWLYALLEIIAEKTGYAKAEDYLTLFNEGVFTEVSPYRLIPHGLLLFVYWLCRTSWVMIYSTRMLVRIHFTGVFIFVALSPFPALAYRISDLFLFSGVLLIGRLRGCLPPLLYYSFAIIYASVFLFYTTLFSGLFISND